MENGRELAVCGTKSLIYLPLFLSEIPEGIDVQEYCKAHGSQKRWDKTYRKNGMVPVGEQRDTKKCDGNHKSSDGTPPNVGVEQVRKYLRRFRKTGQIHARQHQNRRS
jgi:hypothetical protein